MFNPDVAVFLWINATTSTPPWIILLARFASLELPQLLIAGTAGAFLVGDTNVRRIVLRIGFAMLVAWMIARLGQHLLPMPRPFVLGLGTAWIPHGGSGAFPSTHASVAFAFAASIAAFAHGRIFAAAALIAATLVGWSRVSLGIHFPSDILVGAAVGFASAWLSRAIPTPVPAPRAAHE